MTNAEIFRELNEYERHFNNIQAGIRAFASTWILAAFGGIAMLMRVDPENGKWLISPPVLVGVACLLSVVGMSILWIMDLQVYHKLLNSVFLPGLKLEYDSPSIPPIRSFMMASFQGTGVPLLLRLFYFVPMLTFVVLTICAIVLEPQIPSDKCGAFSQVGHNVLLIIVSLEIGAAVFTWFWNHHPLIWERAAWFGDDGFTKLFQQGSQGFAGIVKRFDTHGKRPKRG